MNNRLPGSVRRDANGAPIVSFPAYPSPDMMAPALDYRETPPNPGLDASPSNPSRPVDGVTFSVGGAEGTVP